MIVRVADTQTAAWYLFGDFHISAAAKLFIDKAGVTQHSIHPAPVTPTHVLKEAPFTSQVVEAMWQVARAEVHDMPDRIIAATAVYLGLPVISRDRRIRASAVRPIWQSRKAREWFHSSIKL